MHTRIIRLPHLKNSSLPNNIAKLFEKKSFVEPGILSGLLRLPKIKRYLILK